MTDETIRTYDKVAEGWNNFRQKPMFPKWFDYLVKRWDNGSTVLDIGCGNARNMIPFKDKFDLTGIDKSEGMIKIAKEFSKKNNIKAEFHVSDAKALPLDDNSIDNAISIAVYHHFSPEEIKDVLKELRRILKPDGEAFITFWNRLQKKFILKRSDQKISWTRRKDDKTYYRYYHLYTPWKIRKIIERAGFVILMEGSEKGMKKVLFSRNICFLIRNSY